MLQLRLQPDLAQKSRGTQHGRVLVLQDLDRDGMELDSIPGSKHNRHPAAPDLFPDLIARKNGALQLFMQLAGVVGHLPDGAVRSA